LVFFESWTHVFQTWANVHYNICKNINKTLNVFLLIGLTMTCLNMWQEYGCRHSGWKYTTFTARRTRGYLWITNTADTGCYSDGLFTRTDERMTLSGWSKDFGDFDSTLREDREKKTFVFMWLHETIYNKWLLDRIKIIGMSDPFINSFKFFLKLNFELWLYCSRGAKYFQDYPRIISIIAILK